MEQLQERFRDMSDAESDRDIEQQRSEGYRLEQVKEEVGRSFGMIRQGFAKRDSAIDQLSRTVHEHHWTILEVLHEAQLELREELCQLRQCRLSDSRDLERHVREAREARGDLESPSAHAPC